MQARDLIFLKLAASPAREAVTQTALSKSAGCALSSANAALKHLKGIGAVRVGASGTRIEDRRKFLAYWATKRNIQKDVAFSRSVGMPVQKIEASLPSSAALTAYGAYRRIYGDAPADYSETYAYADEGTAKEIQRRFAREDGASPNLFILRAPAALAGFCKGGAVPAELAYVDLWNLGTWYASEYLNALEAKLLG
jgi:hypothetical protein